MRLIVGVLLASALFAQSPGFEVASIHPTAPAAADRPVRRGMSLANGKFDARGVTVRMLIENAYRLQPFQVTGLPDWAESDQFDILASAPGAENNEQLRPMIAGLLEERFGLKFRRESKEQTVYALQTRGEVKLKPTENPGRAMMRVTIGRESREIKNEFQATSMARLAETLGRELTRMVIDETGLTGEYDFALLSEREPEEANRFVSRLAPLIGTLGLRLESRKGMVDIYMIEAIERPSEN